MKRAANAAQPAAAVPRKQLPATEPQAPEDQFKGRDLGIRFNPADDLPPAKLVRILRDVQGGNIVEGAKMMAAMEQRDSVIGGFMQTRRAGVLACGYEIVPDDEAEDEAAADEATALVKEHVARLDTGAGLADWAEEVRFVPTWKDILAIALDAIGKEFSVLEMLWETTSGEWAIREAEWRPQWWFQFGGGSTASDVPRNVLRLRDLTTEGAPLLPQNFFIHRQHALCGAPGTTALLLGLTRPFVVTNYSIRDALQVAEVFGMPYRVGFYEPTATAEERTAMWNALYGMATNGCALLPKGTEFNLKETSSANAGTIYERLLEIADKWKALSILGQLSSIEEGGSFAKATALQMIRFDLLDADAEALEASVRQQLFSRMVRYNLGANVPVPKLVIPRQAPRDLKAMVETYQAAAGLGIRIGRGWAQEELGIPEPADDEETLALAAAPGPFGVPPSGGLLPAPKEEAGAEPAAPMPDGTAAEPAAAPAEEKRAQLLEMVGGISGMIDILKSLREETITRETAIQMVMLFYRVERPQAEALINTSGQEPLPEAAAANVAAVAGQKKNSPAASRARSERFVC